MLMAAKYPQGYLEFRETYGQNFNGCTHVLEVELFSGVVDDVTSLRKSRYIANTTGSRIIPEIHIAVVLATTSLNRATSKRWI